MDKVEPLLLRIDDYLLEVNIVGENTDGTLSVGYKVISKDQDEVIDFEDLEKKLNDAITKIIQHKFDDETA